MRMNDPCISIAVCTYNRSAILLGCLNSLTEQDIGREIFEILIIDNKSTDHTRDLAMRFVNKYENIRLIYEEKQGLGNARNRGWQEARGEYVAYIDDDAQAHRDWVSEMYNFILRHPEVQSFGGPSFPFSLVELPDWMPAGFGKIYLGEKERPIRFGREWIIGCNMVFTKSILREFGGFKSDIGMTGSKISYGEEIELFRRIGSKEETVYYVPSMKVDHFIPYERVKVSWLFKSYYARGRSKARRNNILLPFYRVLIRFFMRIIRAPIIIISNQDRSLKGRMIDASIPIVSGLGMVIERIMIGLGFEHIERVWKV